VPLPPFLTSQPSYNHCVHRRLRRALLLWACAGSLTGVITPTATRADARSGIDDLKNEASALPSEFAADLLIRIAGSPAIEDSSDKRTLLDSAFMRAYGAQEPYKRAAPPPQTPIDSRAGGYTRAFATGLDVLTLQLRATMAMVPVDAARARELFEWIDFYLPAASCDSALVPVTDEYYAALTAIARQTFGPWSTPDSNGDALRFFTLYLWHAHLPSEVPAVARAVRALRLRRPDAAYLEGTLQTMVDHMDHDARGFSTYGLDIVSKMSDLANDNRSEGVFGETVMRGLRKLLVGELSASRCGDSVSEGPITEHFNGIVRRNDLPRDLVPPIAANEARPLKVLGRAQVDRYWQTPEAQRLYAGLRRLRDAAGTGARVPLIKRSNEWQMEAQSYLMDLERWNGVHEPVDRDYFDEKALLFDVYMDVVPSGALRTRAVRSLIEFLRRSRTGREPRTLWFAHVTRLLQRHDPATIPTMEQSGDDIMATYARAERLLATRN